PISLSHPHTPHPPPPFPTRRSSDLTYPIALQRDRLQVDGPALTAFAMTRPHHNQVGISVAWTNKFMAGGSRQDSIPESDLVDLLDRKSTRLNSSHVSISYAVFCLKK